MSLVASLVTTEFSNEQITSSSGGILYSCVCVCVVLGLGCVCVCVGGVVRGRCGVCVVLGCVCAYFDYTLCIITRVDVLQWC